MGFYRLGPPGDDVSAHINFGRKAGPAPCVAPRFEHDKPALGEHCRRPSEALCDGPAGKDLSGKPLTCDAPMCRYHRTAVRPTIDLCPRCVAKGVQV